MIANIKFAAINEVHGNVLEIFLPLYALFTIQRGDNGFENCEVSNFQSIQYVYNLSTIGDGSTQLNIYSDLKRPLGKYCKCHPLLTVQYNLTIYYFAVNLGI